MMFGHYPTDTLISLSIFGISLWMLFIFRTNIIMTIFSLELLLLSNILGFSISAAYLNDIVGEIFSLYIIVIAAIETAIALCIVISYYRVTNNYINIKHEFTETFLSGFILLQIHGKTYDIFTIENLVLSITLIIATYYFIVGMFMDFIPALISVFYYTRYYLVEDTNTIAYVIRLAYPQWLWLFRTPKPHKKRDELFLKLKHLGYRLKWREMRLIGKIWSLLDREFNPKRFNYLRTKYYGLYGHIDWTFYGYKRARWEVRHYSWYTRFVAPYTVVGQAFLMEEEHFLDLTYQKRKYDRIIKAKDDQIEQLNDIIKVKDAYIEMYKRQF